MVKNYRKRYPYCYSLMRLSLLTLLFQVFVLSALATSFASAQDITLEMKQTTVKNIFSAIEKQVGVSFTFNENTISKLPNIDISISKRPLTEVLAELERRLPIRFKQIGKTIAVSSKQANRNPSTDLSLIPITGTVKDENDKPIPGASIRIKGRDVFTSTDNNGNFRIEAQTNETLLISYIGYTIQEYTIINGNPATIKLSPDTSMLQEVSIVSTGYQDIPKERATGSFSKIDNQLFDRQVSTDVISRLKGIAPAMLFDERNGSQSNFSIRGRSTIFANSSPLIVIDNFPYDGDISSINPNDIESITLLKDAGAASIWGVRAGNGVLVITTKKGAINKPLTIELNTNVTVGQKPDVFYGDNFLNANDYITMEQDLFSKGFYDGDINNAARPILSPVVEILSRQRSGAISASEATEQINRLRNIDVRNDYDKYLYRNSINQQYALNISGGTNKTSYMVSAGYDNNRQAALGEDFARLTLSTNNTFKPSRWIELTNAVFYTQSKSGSAPSSSSDIVLSSSKSLYPYARLADMNGNALPIANNYSLSWIQSLPATQLLDWQYRPLDEIRLADNLSDVNYLRINPSLRMQLLDGLSFDVKYQHERSATNNNNLRNEDTFFARDLVNRYTQISGSSVIRPIPSGGVLDQSLGQTIGNTGRLQLNYLKSFRDHSIAMLGGYEIKELKGIYTSNRLYGYNDLLGNHNSTLDYTTNFPFYVNGADRIPFIATTQETIDRYRSYFANGSYTYRQRYMLSLSGRIDQSNLFGVRTNQKGVPLWSIGLSWNISEEPFYKSSAVPFLKLRATYGESGNVDKSVTALTTGSFRTNTQTGARSILLVNPGNSELRWERIRMFNAGLDFALLNSRINGSLEYYHKKGIDILGNALIDPTHGILDGSNLPVVKGNFSDMKGHGVDLQLSTKNVTGSFSWITDYLFSYNRDEVTRYDVSATTTNYLNFGAGTTELATYPMVGRPVYSIYSLKWAGLDPTNGDPLGIDASGATMKDYTALTSVGPEQLVYNGPALPVFFGSFRNTITYRRFSLSANITFKAGYYFRRSSVDYTALRNNWRGHSDFSSRWIKPGDEASTDVPSMPAIGTTANRDQFYKFSEALVEKGDHVRLQDVRLGYDLDAVQLKNVHLRGLGLFLYVANPGVIWRANNKNLDPDLYGNILPLPVTFAFGFKGRF